MKKLLMSLALLLSVGFATASQDYEVSPYGEVFVGDGVRVELARFKAKNEHDMNDVIVRVSGRLAYDAGMDGEVFRLKAIPAGTGFNLQRPDGRNLIGSRARGGWLGTWTDIKIYLNNQSIDLVKTPEDLNALHLLGAYKTKQQENKKK